jgi:DNA-binding MarR family transcriptional regulator
MDLPVTTKSEMKQAEAATPTADRPSGSMVLLTHLSRVVYRRSTEKLLGMRLKPYVALRHLRESPSCSQQALGESLMVDANNLVLLLNELEAAGHVTRRRDQSDRRRHIVELTDAGRDALERAEEGMNSVEDEVLRGLTAEERETLSTLLQRAVDGAGPDSPLPC